SNSPRSGSTLRQKTATSAWRTSYGEAMLSSMTHARTCPASCKATSGLTILIHVEGQSRGRIAKTRGGNTAIGEIINPAWPANQLELDPRGKIALRSIGIERLRTY